MAKPRFCHGLLGLSGKLKGDKMVFAFNKETNTFTARREAEFSEEGRHYTFGLVGKNLKDLYHQISPEYRNDLYLYSRLLRLKVAGKQRPICGMYSMFIHMMWNLKEAYPEVELLKITLDDIRGKEYPVRSIREAMKFRLLENVKCDIPLDHEI
jgi:hypothetical protein